jgi:hypothetical protein
VWSLLYVVGLLVVLYGWAALLATFVLPRGRGLFQRLPRRVIRLVHLSLIWLSHLTPKFSDKDAILAGVGPIGLLVQLAMFLVVFVAGFSLMLYPATHNVSLAVGQAAAAVFTVGLAHISGPTNDTVVVLGAASGAIAIALQVGYLPAIYQSFSRREALVALMESRAGIPAWGPEVLLRQQLVGSVDALPSFYRDWEGWAAEVAESHTTRPVLLLFRSPEAGFSWVLSLLAVLDAAALQLAVAPSTAPSEARLCLRMGFTMLRRLANSMGWPYNPDPQPDDPIDLDFPSFSAAIDQLVAIDFPMERSAIEAWPHFRGWRVSYEAIAYRMADYLVMPYAPWSGPRRHLSAQVMLPNRPPHRSPDGRILAEGWFRGGQSSSSSGSEAVGDSVGGNVGDRSVPRSRRWGTP